MVKNYAIEPFSCHEARYQHNCEELFDQNVAEWGLSANVVKVKMTSDKAAREWSRQIDFLYVDGDHSYEVVVRDITKVIPFIRTGGLFAFHDYKPVGKEGIKRAVDELVMPYHRIMFIAGSLICFQKPRESVADYA